MHEFEAFRAVARAGSFNGGARALGLTPSAMSQIVRRLEDRVGVQLFHRTTRRVSPTEMGERLLTRLNRAFEEIDAAAAEIRGGSGAPVGVVRMVVPRVAYEDLIEPQLVALHAALPRVTLDIRVEDAFSDIVGEGVDIGVRLGEFVSEETVAFPLGPQLRQIAVAAPSYLATCEAPAHPRDLARHRCIGWRQQTGAAPYRWEFAKNGEQIAVAVDGPLILSDRGAAARAAVRGLGIALWVEHRLRPWIEARQLIPLLEDWSPPYDGFFAYYHRNRHTSAATRAVVAFLRKVPGDQGAALSSEPMRRFHPGVLR
ncbi:LysR family transcriptional regulator [Pararoseomonas sp. SCSIO 73927]|uniref:LysR family transcriptional regulator n=1 Tax=Pararoseomonas sp. SCSIO 73927 TaxID=3114537 RepID=UPI0030D383F7